RMRIPLRSSCFRNCSTLSGKNACSTAPCSFAYSCAFSILMAAFSNATVIPFIRSMERETGIEPATNSLEGCDSTTELLPPTRSPSSLLALRPVDPPGALQDFAEHQNRDMRRLACQPKLAESLYFFARDARERRLVAREGLEPSKPLGRQIYSLLRLTASLPRQASVCVGKPCFWSYLKDRMHSVDGAGEGI